jgi:hypothetical protein
MASNLVPLTSEGARRIATLFRAAIPHYAANQDEFAALLNAVAQKLDFPQAVKFNQPKINRLCHLGEENGQKTLSRHYLQCWEPFLPFSMEELEEIAAGEREIPSVKHLVFPNLPSELRFLGKKKFLHKEYYRAVLPPVILIYPGKNRCLEQRG